MRCSICKALRHNVRHSIRVHLCNNIILALSAYTRMYVFITMTFRFPSDFDCAQNVIVFIFIRIQCCSSSCVCSAAKWLKRQTNSRQFTIPRRRRYSLFSLFGFQVFVVHIFVFAQNVDDSMVLIWRQEVRKRNSTTTAVVNSAKSDLLCTIFYSSLQDICAGTVVQYMQTRCELLHSQHNAYPCSVYRTSSSVITSAFTHAILNWAAHEQQSYLRSD